MGELIPTFDNIKELFQAKKCKKLAKLLMLAFEEKKGGDLTEIYDWLGELTKMEPFWFLSYCYHYTRDLASKILSVQTLLEMDKYLLEKYAFSDVEHLIASSKATFERPKAKLTGHVFLTNFRFLGAGFLAEKGSTPGTGPKGLVGLAFALKKDAQINAIRRALVKSLGDKFSEDALKIFNHNFPIMDAYNIKRGNSKISYTVTIKYEHKGKPKQDVLTFTVTAKKEKNEPSDAFEARKKNFLDAVEETLMKAQST